MPRIALVSLIFLLLPGGLVVAHGDLDEVIKNVSAELVRNPGNETLLLRRAELFRLHGDWASAKADYEEILRSHPGLAAADLGLAELDVAQGHDKAALERLNRFLAEYPEHIDALLVRAGVLERGGDWRLAAKDLAAAAAASSEPHHATAHAELLLRHGQTIEAVRRLDAASLARGGVPVLEQRALDIEEQAGRTSEALARLDRFIAREPRPDVWLVRKAKLLEKSGRRDEAAAVWHLAAAAFESVPAEKRKMDFNRKLHAAIHAGLASGAGGAP